MSESCKLDFIKAWKYQRNVTTNIVWYIFDSTNEVILCGVNYFFADRSFLKFWSHLLRCEFNYLHTNFICCYNSLKINELLFKVKWRKQIVQVVLRAQCKRKISIFNIMVLIKKLFSDGKTLRWECLNFYNFREENLFLHLLHVVKISLNEINSGLLKWRLHFLK